MIKDIVAATFTFFRSIESIPIKIEQVNDLSAIGYDRLLKFKLSFNQDYSIACYMTYTRDWVNIEVYTLNDEGKYQFFVHANA